MFKLSDEGLKYVKSELERYETKQSAIIRCLYRAQDENGGWVSPEVIQHLSEVMSIPAAQIDEVATFYTMFNKEPVGKHHIQVCTTLTCGMLGGRELCDSMMKEAGCKSLGDISPDGLFTFSKVECLGSCDTAPMLQVNRDPYIESLNTEKGIELVRKLRASSGTGAGGTKGH
ncbi:MAG: NAD(P)H-dependent oxidoreductase subunit E [Bdellovibrionales bacterium]|jgi:NADH-quinone oxidoreductase subunit E|nr:NAD(P)H-dependent oxidoreductase subunit E [Bdellovibrionales bacterium]